MRRPGLDPHAALRGLVPALVGVLVLGGCSGGSTSGDRTGSGPSAPRSTEAAGPDAAGGLAAPAGTADVAAQVRRILRARARAVRRHDEAAFEATLGRRARFRTAQRVWFDNLVQLPIGTLRYRLDAGSLVRDGDTYRAVVEVSLGLAGYDETPVVSLARYAFAPADGRLRLTGVHDHAWEREHPMPTQPWDQGPVLVRSVRGVPGVLGVFDARTVVSADALLGSVRRGIDAVARAVPLRWSRTVVVYALGDRAPVEQWGDVPGGDPQRLDAVAFPVPSVGEHAGRPSYRFALRPGLLRRSGRVRDRLVRHELTHVAVGPAADDVPVWLSEGLAEWVSVQPLAPRERTLARPAVTAAERALDEHVSTLPTDATFNDQDAVAHYGTAWWVCEYLARRFGRQEPWRLLRELPEATGVEQVTGLDEGQLARRASRLLVRTYDPAHLRRPRRPPGAGGGSGGAGGQGAPPGPPSASPSPSSASSASSPSPSSRPSGSSSRSTLPTVPRDRLH